MNKIGKRHSDLIRVSPQVEVDVLLDQQTRVAIQAIADTVPAPRETPLSPRLLLWICLGMALYRPESIPNTLTRLLGRLRGILPNVPLHPVSDGAIAHGRKRLGPRRLQEFFEFTTTRVAPEPSFHGRVVYAMDGTTFSVPDTAANDAAFGRHRASHGMTAFPALRALLLASAVTREIKAASWCPYAQSENSLIPGVIKALSKGDLVLLDRGLASRRLAADLHAQGVSFVMRARSNWLFEVVEHLADGDDLVRVSLSKADRRADPTRRDLVLRRIQYQVGGDHVVLLTDLLDPNIPAMEIAELYHERWESETIFDEIKTHLLSIRHGGLDLPFRSKSPALVEQEFWSTLATYNLVRRTMRTAAAAHEIDPREISFTQALVVITSSKTRRRRSARSTNRAAHVEVINDLLGCVLTRQRRSRICPRGVRRKHSPYPHKKKGECEVPRHLIPQIRLGAA